MNNDQELERLVRTLTENEPSELRTYLTLPEEGRPLIGGSTAPAILPTVFEPSGITNLLVPVGSGPSPSDFAASYLTSEEYLNLTIEGTGVPTELLILHFASAYPREVTLINLAMLNGLLFSESKQAELRQEFRLLLSDDIRSRFDAAMSARHRDPYQRIIARQPLLSAMRDVFTMDEVEQPSESMPAMAAAIMLSHAVATTLSEEASPTQEELMGIPAHLALEIVQVSFLNQAGDIYASIARTARLWRDYGPRVENYKMRAEPAAILAEATGIAFEDLLALGFALLAYSMQWEPGKPPFLRDDMGSTMDPAVLESFAALISDSFDGFRDSFAEATSRFDFTPIQQRPALLADAGFLVLDPAFLWERVTSGLYWYVHDHEKARDEESRQLWTQCYSEMVELMVEDQLERLSPIVLGDAEQSKTFYTEEEFARAYSGRTCDAAIHFGSEIVLFEVVSGQMTTLTRIEGSKEQLIRDTEKLVIKKCRQLDATAKNILANESALTGLPSFTGLRILPIVVVTEGYPLNVLTAALIRKMLQDEGLLSDSRLESLGIVDLEDLDLLEGLHEAGHSLLDGLLRWRNGPLADTSLRTFLSSVPEYRDIDRPAGVVKQTREVFRDLLGRLGLSGGEAEASEIEV